jgi:acyl-CoA thioesterase II
VDAAGDARVCTWGGFLFGGAGLGAAISALEGTSGRHAVWATGQYLSYAKPGEVMDIDVTIAVEGHQITQARAVGHVGNREILTVNAALGDRPDVPAGQFETMPEVAAPGECTRRPRVGRAREHQRPPRAADREGSRPRRARRCVRRRSDDRVGAHPEPDRGVDASALAVLGDFVPMGVGEALGIKGGGNSLDNTLRVVRLVPTEWVLLDIRVHGVERGFGHGLVHMFAEDGTLMATASQSCIVRFWKG